MNAVTSDTVLVVCSVLKAEIEELHRNQWQHVPIRFLSSMLHMKPVLLQEQLHAVISDEQDLGHKTLLVYGDCCSAMTDFETLPDVVRTPCHNCCALLLGKTEYKRLEHEGVFFLIPEWTQRWREVFSKELGLNQDNARDLMGEMHSKLVYLDTGLALIPLEELQACSEYVGLPYEIMPINLSNLESALNLAFEKLEDREAPRDTNK